MVFIGQRSRTGYRNRRVETRARNYFDNILIDKVYVLSVPQDNNKWLIIGACRSMRAVRYYSAIYRGLRYKLVNMMYPEAEVGSVRNWREIHTDNTDMLNHLYE